jgi:peptidoglycan hydrolase-like amidase
MVGNDQPYLVTKKDPYDDWSGNPYDPDTTQVSAGAIEKAVPPVGNLESITIDKRDGHGTWNGRVLAMTLQGSGGTTSISGSTFQSRLGLYSNWFDISVCSTCNRSWRLPAG